MTTYTASKSQTQGRPGWSINFRHPLRRDSRNKPGLKVRRGLGTTSADEADDLVRQMNALLSDDRWWSITRRVEALVEFDSRVVDAFYDEVEPAQTDTRALRQSLLPLPGRADGYSRVLLVGTTGAGKTSLVRQLIGTDPDEDRFPSSSLAGSIKRRSHSFQRRTPEGASKSAFSMRVQQCLKATATNALWRGC
jgi:hypothetical protein